MRWRAPIALGIREQPAVADGRLFVVGSPFGAEGLGTGIVVALDAATGAERWRAAGAQAASAPAVADGSVYVGLATGAIVVRDGRARHEGGGALLALDAATGSERWRLELAGPTGDPVVADGMVYATTVDLAAFFADPQTNATSTWLAAAEAVDGFERWRVAVGSVGLPFPYRPAVAGDVIFALGDDVVSVVAVDAATGVFRRRVELPGGAPVDFAPSVAAGLVVVAAGFALYGLDAATGRIHWAIPPYAPEVRLDEGLLLLAAPPVVSGDGVYVVVESADGDGKVLLAVDVATGRERWRATKATAALVVADDVVYVVDVEGILLALDVGSGAERWRLPVGGVPLAQPIASGGIVYGATVTVAEEDAERSGVLFAAVG